MPLAPGVQENVDSVDELQFAADMRVFRDSVVKDVPAIVARDAGIAKREQEKQEREERAQLEAVVPGAAGEAVKRRRTGLVVGSAARGEQRRRAREERERESVRSGVRWARPDSGLIVQGAFRRTGRRLTSITKCRMPPLCLVSLPPSLTRTAPPR